LRSAGFLQPIFGCLQHRAVYTIQV
jgi:hypothetical protein